MLVLKYAYPLGVLVGLRRNYFSAGERVGSAGPVSGDGRGGGGGTGVHLFSGVAPTTAVLWSGYAQSRHDG